MGEYTLIGIYFFQTVLLKLAYGCSIREKEELEGIGGKQQCLEFRPGTLSEWRAF